VTARSTLRRLADLVEIQNGYAFDSRSFSSASGTPLIRIRDLRRGTTTETRYDGDYDPRYLVHAGDLLVGMDGEFACYEWRGGPALLNQRVCRIQSFESALLPRYLFYGINQHLKEIEDSTGYTTVKHLSSGSILDIEMPIPPLADQKRTVAVLDEAFAAIATARANTEQNLRHAREVFESHLHSVFARRSEAWGVKRIEEIASHSLGKMLDKAKNKGESHQYLRNLNVRWFAFDLSDVLEMRFLPEEAAKYTVVRGDVLVCEGGYPGRAAIWNEDYPIHFQKALHRVRFHEPEHNKWFVYYLLAQDLSGDLKQHFGGTGIQHFTGEALARFELPIPPMSELRLAVTKLDDLSMETQRLASVYQRKLAALDALKQSLLHQAFAGAL